MSRINLQQDEVVLFEGDVSITGHSTSVGVFSNNTIELVLTNLRIYFVRVIKKMFSKEQVNIDSYDICDIKVYNGVPQVKQIKTGSCEVILSLISCEMHIEFESAFEAIKFVNSAYKLITGKSAAARGAEKFKGAVNMVNDALGIDAVDTVKSVLENGIARTALGGFSKKKQSKARSFLGEAVGASKVLLENQQKKPEESKQQPIASYDSQLETLKKLKELLDMGVLTQEEFDTKKKEILGL